MKTVLFFDRCELTNYYILLSKKLENKVNIIHVAYSNREIELLRAADIMDFIDYRSLLEQALNSIENIDTRGLINEIDEIILKESNGRFNLNGSIESDRGYSILEYDEALKIALCHYLVWKQIFASTHVDIMYHEPCSMFMTHIAALLCKAQGGIYRYQLQVSSDLNYFTYLNLDGETFACPEISNRYHFLCQHKKDVNYDRSIKFLKKYREDYSVFLGGMINAKRSKYRIRINALKHILYKKLYGKKYNRLIDNIDYWNINFNNVYIDKLHNINDYKRRHIEYVSEIPLNEEYYYYSMHLEPEAVVLYVGDGIYTNQIKLIENIAASLPPGHYLYVKDHPHEYAYRRADDYDRLAKIPNIRLIHPQISGKELIAGAKGVFTINGTAGFEALLMGKQVFCFGKSFYSCQERIKYIHNIRDLRAEIYKLKDTVYQDDDNLIAFISSYLSSLHKGFVTYFGDRAQKSGINEEDNASGIAEDLLRELNDEAR